MIIRIGYVRHHTSGDAAGGLWWKAESMLESDRSYAGADPIAATVPFRRLEPRPRMQTILPYCQLDQWPPETVFQTLVDRCLRLDGVRGRESRMSSRDSLALYLPDESVAGPVEAFIDDHEFCHLHPLPEGSILLTLPKPVRQRAIEQGWGELHPLARFGPMPPTLVLLYAPRNGGELEVVWKLIDASYRFALGDP